jgi:hypothetical protein
MVEGQEKAGSGRLTGRKLATMRLYLANGSVHVFKYVEVLRDDGSYLQFYYVSEDNKVKYEAVFYVNSLIGCAWTV